jgi:TPR repeat protein
MMRNKLILYFVFILFTGTHASAQSTLDKLILEEAQTAYANGQYSLCLEKLDELEKKGSKGLVLAHLKIMATSKLPESHLSYWRVVQLKKDVEYYLKNYDNEDFLPQYKDVYEVSKTLSDKKYDEGILAEKNAQTYYNAKDYKNAMQWFLKADSYGNPSDKIGFYTGLMYEKGWGVEQNYTEAAKWYTKSAEQGNVNAQALLGYFFNVGQGVEKDYKKAVAWYTKAAEKGNAGAQYNLGVIYKNGEGVEKDYKKAFEWYTKAANQGNVSAQHALGLLYANGEGVEKDLDKAIEFFKKAVEGGYKNYHYLAFTYEKIGNYNEAFKYFQQGNEIGKLGFYAYEGKIAEQDYAKAVEYWESFSQKNPIGNLGLAVAYYSGNGVPKDDAKALLLIKGVIEKYNDYDYDILKNYKEDREYNKKHFPKYSKDEDAFFEWLAKEHNIVFEK